jgi:hypothetical protein
MGASAHSATGAYGPDSDRWLFTVDTSTPAPAITNIVDAVGPIQGTVPNGGITDDARPTISGTGVAGNTVYIYANGRGVADTIVDGTGHWSVRTNKDIDSGVNKITATQFPSGQSESAASNTWTITVDTTTPATPAAPVITDNGMTIPSGGTMPDGHPVISGSGTSGDTIKVYDNGNLIGSTTIGGDGKWSYRPSTDLSNGAHSISVIETNPAGNSSSQSAAIYVTVSPGPTETVSITGLYDDTAGVQLAVPVGGRTFDSSPIVKGTISSSLLSGETLAVYRDGIKLAGTATMNGNTWSYKDSGVAVGDHTYTARVESAKGAGPTSASYSFTEYSSLDMGGSISAYTGGWGMRLETSLPSSVGIGGSAGGAAYYSLKYYDYWGRFLKVLIGPNYTASGAIILPSLGGGYYVATVYLVTNGVMGPEIPYVIVDSAAIGNNVRTDRSTEMPSYKEIPDVLLPQFTYSPSSLVSAVRDMDSAHAQTASVADVDSHAQVDHHTVVGTHEAFIGSTTNAHETVDLNMDPASYFKEATAHIEGAKGGAVDTLHLTGDHQILDLTSLTGKTAAAKISGIEVIDLGGHENTLKLSLVDVLNLGEVDLFQEDGKQQLMVNGKEGDMVDLSNSHIAGLAEGEWQQHGTTQVGGVTYNVYEHSGAHTELLIQQGVQIVVH